MPPDEQHPTHAPRISLTKRQLQTEEALDLLALLQTVTADGRLDDEEIQQLSAWVADHEHSELPAVGHLGTVLTKSLEDGVITNEERKWIQGAIETALPVEIRKEAAVRRREATVADREAAREERERLAAEERKKTSVDTFDFMVAGLAYGNRDELVRTYVSEGSRVFLVREPSNAHSRSAILVSLENGLSIGYVPEGDERDLAPLLDHGCKQQAWVKKILNGHKGPIPVIMAKIYAPDAPVEGAIGSSDLPRRPASQRTEDVPYRPHRPLPVAEPEKSGFGAPGWLLVGALAGLLGLAVLMSILSGQ